jgi:transposase
MGRTNKPILTVEGRLALEAGHKNGKQPVYRQRCQIILLKADGRTSADVARIVNQCTMSVNNWVVRYAESGIEGLLTKTGRGRKPTLTVEADGEAVRRAVESNRQQLEQAKLTFEAESKKEVSRATLRRFLKVLAVDING